jgi:hypothetical protein
MTISRTAGHRVNQRNRGFDKRYIAILAVVAVVAVAGIAYAVWPNSSSYTPMAGADHAGSLVLNDSGSQLVATAAAR